MDEKLKLLNYIKNYHKEQGKFPLFSDIENFLGVERYKVLQLMRELEEEGKVHRNYSVYRMPVEEKKIKKIEKKISSFSKLDILLYIVLLSGILSVFLSIYYNMYWFRMNNGVAVSVLFSVCLVSFSVGSFEVGIHFFMSKKRMISTIFFILWLSIFAFNMLIISAGIYTKYHKTTKQEQVHIARENVDSLLLSDLIVHENELLKDIELKEVERIRWLNIITEFDTFEKQKEHAYSIRVYTNNKNNIEKQIAYIKNKLQNIREEIKELKSKGTQIKVVDNNKADFFEYLGGIVKADPEWLRLWTQLIPALMLNIIDCWSFSIFLFFKKD